MTPSFLVLTTGRKMAVSITEMWKDMDGRFFVGKGKSERLGDVNFDISDKYPGGSIGLAV